MTIAGPVKSHHTVWVQGPRGRPRAVRYALDGERVVCFGDGPLADLPDRTAVTATVHEIAGGPPLATFTATVRDVAPDDVERNAVLELLDHVPLGRTREEVDANFEHHRSSRRLVVLERS